MDLQGFGNGQDGVATLSGTDTPVDSSCSGTGGTKSLTATNASFASNRLVFIHQSRGTGAGNYEFNVIDSYVAGTITTAFNLVNTYYDSGNSQAQVLVVKEYSQVTVSGTFTAKAWDGNVGGILMFLCSGDTIVSGTITANGATGLQATSGNNGGVVNGGGFRGGPANWGRDNNYGSQGTQGESSAGVGTKSTSPNAEGGGGGSHNNTAVGQAGAGGGGANALSASSGQSGAQGSGGTGGYGRNAGAYGTPTTFATMLFGGGGGGGGGGYNYSSDEAGAGGNGGGIIYIMTRSITVTGSITANGGNGGTSNIYADGSTGGGGGGGSIYIRAETAVLGTSLITALGGAGGLDTGGGTRTRIGGAGSVGQIRIEACTRTGSTNPTAIESIGGNSWCQVPGSIY